jgi:hypothetical protein
MADNDGAPGSPSVLKGRPLLAGPARVVATIARRQWETEAVQTPQLTFGLADALYVLRQLGTDNVDLQVHGSDLQVSRQQGTDYVDLQVHGSDLQVTTGNRLC